MGHRRGNGNIRRDDGADDSSREYVLGCELGKYYFYYLYIYVYFIKYNVFFLCISE